MKEMASVAALRARRRGTRVRCDAPRPDKGNDKLKLWIYDSSNGRTKATQRNTQRLTAELTHWAEHLTKALGKKVTVELMNVGNQSAQDHYSCGVWALMATKAWMHYQKTCPEGHWPTHYNEAVSKWGTTNRAAVDAYRKSILQQLVKERMATAEGQRRAQTDSQQAAEAQRPSNDPNTNPEVGRQAPQTQEGRRKSATKQPGLWKWLHKLVPTTPPSDDGHALEEQRAPETRPDEEEGEVGDEPTTQWEKFESTQPEALGASRDPQDYQPPLTEPVKMDIGEDRLHMLTWNVAGQSDSCLDLAEVISGYYPNSWSSHKDQRAMTIMSATWIFEAHTCFWHHIYESIE
ncbi:hypothetical protein CYMTET_11627 [Cymbomonas tetramitiformis]|uniref:Uncharacterized protein n=1 Tax=Cymbomonas tetramitiformis TaxID=36881 RepID=A0AAE0LCU3_9CHLO|nr:hypothetical protein CYMTET_11627 [Cymbomonas tetramitiformis]